jgi:hypothetical protein
MAITMAITVDESGSFVTASRDTDEQRAYVFVANDALPEMKQKYPQLNVSIELSLGAIYLLMTKKDIDRLFCRKRVWFSKQDDCISCYCMYRLSYLESEC